MQLSFTPKAARKVQEIMAGKGGQLALRIRIRRGMTGVEWKMTLEPSSAEAVVVEGGVPVLADQQSRSYLEGVIIDWIQTPNGPGFGIFDRSLAQQDIRLGAD